MFKINKKMEYALIALKHMSGKTPGQLTSAKEICELYHTPFDPTSRVLQIMTQNSILQAEQGAKGGYQIVKNLSKVSTRELSDMIVGPIKITNCAHDDLSKCNIASKCLISNAMINLNTSIQKLFSEIMIGDLIGTTFNGK